MASRSIENRKNGISSQYNPTYWILFPPIPLRKPAASNGDRVTTTFIQILCFYVEKVTNINRFKLSYNVDALRTISDLYIKMRWIVFHVTILIVKFYIGHQDNRVYIENRIRHLEKFKLVSNGNITKNIPFLDDYGDINLVAHVIKSHKAL